MINEANWNTCYYKNNELKAFLSLVAEPDALDEVSIGYAITLTDQDDIELFQENYNILENAVQSINQRYSDWEFVSMVKNNGGGGCASCAAH
ncbi:MAG: hypothetical protein ACPGJV_00845 [Bacteriovoracaceae bacterium]